VFNSCSQDSISFSTFFPQPEQCTGKLLLSALSLVEKGVLQTGS
jgi:hypothetical protein